MGISGFFLKGFVKGLKNVFTSVRHSFLLVLGIAIIAASAAGLLIHVPLLSKWAPAARVFGTLGGCLGMFIISLSYGTKNLSTNNREQFEEKLELAKKGMVETLRKQYDTELKLEMQKRTNADLNKNLKENIKELQEKQKKIEEAKFMLKGKEAEIKRLESMNNTITAISATLELVLFRAKVKQLSVQEAYYDDVDKKIDKDKIIGPTGKLLTAGQFKDKERKYRQYHGIIEQEFGIQGGINLNEIEVCERNDGIYYTGLNATAPQRINPQSRILLSQLREVKFKEDDADPTIEGGQIIKDPYKPGTLDQEYEIRDNPEYKFDDITVKSIKDAGKKFVELLLKPFNKPIFYVDEQEWQTLLNSQTLKDPRSLKGFFNERIDTITQNGDTEKKLLEDMKAEYSVHEKEVLG